MKNKTRILIEIALSVAIAVVLSKIRVFKMPQGGSITLDMLPLAFIAYKRGVKASLFAGILFGTVSLVLIDSPIISIFQPMLDYILPAMAFFVCGFAMRKGLYVKEFLFFIALLLKFLCHFASGVIYYGQYAPEGQSVYMYSLIYNLSYLLPSAVIVMILIYFFEKKNLFNAS
ncbi:MAG: energy-coupled thiamine transporter ThiT [Candidatus Muiribacterium halophilum]|uniref:Energy-coupled thiamine transporter ThiT n=1 Tax=Muiribacterium halophilum TaxID=2053465 RepID=A0A2N5ZD66_MUIH1|nr:MAG: energy-coupled thiamine transporter ThiT [Candidatus Muirbacterium halophilum]